jgi:hypothetical protein
MEDRPRLFIITLEISPLKVGEMYNPLPTHLTLVSRFWTSLTSEELARLVKPVFKNTDKIQLLFGDAAFMGPQRKEVNLIAISYELIRLHMELFELLNSSNALFTNPQWVGGGFKPHITKRKEVFPVGYKQLTEAAYLIEIKIKDNKHFRFVREKFSLSF